MYINLYYRPLGHEKIHTNTLYIILQLLLLTAYDYKIEESFEVISEVLQDPNILSENAYNIDETGVMLSKLGSVKVLVGKDNRRDYRGTGVKRTMMTAIECISADGKSLLPLTI
jgi:hypothetical protein